MAYVSNALTHWVGRKASPDDQYEILADHILKKKELLYSSCHWHFDSKYGGRTKLQIPMICFTDIPFSECSIHCDKFSHFGISFEKHYLANCLACPVGYVQQPFIHNNYSYIYHQLSGMKNTLRGKIIPEGKHKGEVFDIKQILSRWQYMMCFLEDHSEGEFRYNEESELPLSGQDDFFEDPAALYYEREWRMVLSSTAKDLPWHVSHDGKTYFRFNEQHLKWIVLPKEYLGRFQKERSNIFSEYRQAHIPSVIAYEDLKHL